jgi:hypothetical protein
MAKSFNYAIMKKKQVKYYSPLRKLAYNIHVNIFFIILAIVQLLANSLSKVDIDLRNTLYN